MFPDKNIPKMRKTGSISFGLSALGVILFRFVAQRRLRLTYMQLLAALNDSCVHLFLPNKKHQSACRLRGDFVDTCGMKKHLGKSLKVVVLSDTAK